MFIIALLCGIGFIAGIASIIDIITKE
jgi:hypothetical protein